MANYFGVCDALRFQDTFICEDEAMARDSLLTQRECQFIE